MHRFYADSMIDDLANLSAEDRIHAFRVLRMRAGDPCELIFEGFRYSAVMCENGQVRVTEKLSTTEPDLKITLFQGLPKFEKMDWIIQKAVEIGITEIIPVMMKRSIVRLGAGDAEKKLARWQRIAREAGKQSGRCVIPEVRSPEGLSALPSLARSLDACIVPWEEAVSPGILSFSKSHPSLVSLGILIGPEGGIDPAEIQLLQPYFQPLTLGPRILRTETAGLVAASSFLTLYGEME